MCRNLSLCLQIGPQRGWSLIAAETFPAALAAEARRQGLSRRAGPLAARGLISCSSGRENPGSGDRPSRLPTLPAGAGRSPPWRPRLSAVADRRTRRSCSIRTVDNHLQAVYSKLGITGRRESRRRVALDSPGLPVPRLRRATTYLSFVHQPRGPHINRVIQGMVYFFLAVYIARLGVVQERRAPHHHRRRKQCDTFQGNRDRGRYCRNLVDRSRHLISGIRDLGECATTKGVVTSLTDNAHLPVAVGTADRHPAQGNPVEVRCGSTARWSFLLEVVHVGRGLGLAPRALIQPDSSRAGLRLSGLSASIVRGQPGSGAVGCAGSLCDPDQAWLRSPPRSPQTRNPRWTRNPPPPRAHS